MVDKTRVGVILAFLLLLAAVMPPVVTFVITIILSGIALGISLLKLIPAFGKSKEYVPDPSYRPYVAVVIACSNEPAGMMRRVLEALAAQDYENYGVYVIDNNNTRESNWRKIEQTCKELGKKFVFHHEDEIKGYKAGALNYIYAHLPKKTEVVAVVDADYIVQPHYLKETVGYFKDPQVAIVQTPQDYSNKQDNVGLYHDYELFFSRFMNQAQKFDGVTFTGTMGMIRKTLFDTKLAWSERSITEDTEIGIAVHSLGFNGVYIDKSYGQGVMPYNYDSLARQRARWVYGNMQILTSKLWPVIASRAFSFRQKLSFLNQLFAWIHFELVLAILFVANGISWFLYGDTFQCITAKVIAVTLIVTMVAQLLLFLFYSRKTTSLGDRLQGFLAHYGLLPAMTYPWMYCLAGGRLGFIVTKKEKEEKKRSGKRILKGAFIPVLLTIGLILTDWGKMFGIGLFVLIGIVILIELIALIYTLEKFKEL